MAETVAAVYFDGKSARRQNATAALGPQGITIAATDGAPVAFWALGDLTPAEPVRRGRPVRIGVVHDTDARLLVDDARFAAALLARAPRLAPSKRFLAHGLPQVGLGLAAAALLVAAVIYGIPALSRPIAKMVPLSWERDLGRQLVTMIIRDAERCDGAAGRAALDRLVARIAAAQATRYDFNLTVAKRRAVNAFAAPGGEIVILNGLLKEARSPDEVAGVLAHEMAHVVERHPTASAIRALGVSILLELVTGDGAGAAAGLAEVGGLLLLFSYSRENEREADRLAQEMLARAGLKTTGLVDFFQRRAGRNSLYDTALLDYFSTHPPSDERSRDAARPGHGGETALTPAEWQALQAICD